MMTSQVHKSKLEFLHYQVIVVFLLYQLFVLLHYCRTEIRVATGIEKLNSRTFQVIFQDCLSSGAARVYCALGKEIFLGLPSTNALNEK